MNTIPADVPSTQKEIFKSNLSAITRDTNRLLLFAADQKIEHLHQDFYGKQIHVDAAHPEHLFKIAAQGSIGAFATQLGLISRYGSAYPSINYIVKLNSKTNIIKPINLPFWKFFFYQPLANRLYNNDPVSSQLWSVDDAITFQRESGLHIRGVGYTIYLGSQWEPQMLSEAAQLIYQAHQYGLISILWIYPRGFFIKDDTSLEMLAGAAGVANALGADIVKIKTPKDTAEMSAIEQLKIIKQAAGNTKVIISGGGKIERRAFLKRVYGMVHNGSIDGAAVGRNIFQQSLPDAIAMTKALSTIIYDNASLEQAEQLL